MTDFGNSAGKASGLRGGSTWNYGFLGGVRKLREEEEARNIIKGRTMPPGARDYYSRAWNQWNGGAHDKSSGYESDPKNWATKMAMPHLRPGIEGAVKGANPNHDYEDAVQTRSTLSARVKSKVKVQSIAPGVDGVVETGVYGVAPEPDAAGARVPPAQPRAPRAPRAPAGGADTLSIKGGAKTAETTTTEGKISVRSGVSKLLAAMKDKRLAAKIRALHRQGGGGAP